MKPFLAADYGAGSLKLAEFELSESGGLVLRRFGIRPLGLEGSQEAKREAALQKALQELLGELQGAPKEINICAPGSQVFSKFIKLPPVETGKVTKMIEFEAKQNVPFPLEEVVWDYQILGTTPGNELEVLIVAVRKDVVDSLFRVAEKAGLRVQVADASVAALCNAFRYNYGEPDECIMLLDIGAKTSNVLFFEKNRFFSRTINLGANAITQEFAHESKLQFAEAERLKVSEGFVSLGGAYEEPENPQQAAIAKIARQFMTRLHIQVNQTLQFYRGQHGGSAPQRVLLAGGGSIMTYTAQFFAEKLNVPVEYFNPFRSVQIDPSVNLEALSQVAHAFGEVVGVGLRNLAHCPIELNLLPASIRRWQAFEEKRPYFVFTAISLAAVVFATGYLFHRLAKVKEAQLALVQQGDPARNEPGLGALKAKADEFTAVMRERDRLLNQCEQLSTWLQDRYYWVDVMTELRRVLLRVEESARIKFNTDAGVWVERFVTAEPSKAMLGAPEMTPGAPSWERGPAEVDWGRTRPVPLGELPPEARRYGFEGPPPSGGFVYGQPWPPPGTPPEQQAVEGAAPTTPGEISVITLVCSAVSLKSVDPSADTALAFTFLNELRASQLTDPAGTDFFTEIQENEEKGTFTFGVSWKLKRPLKL
ncbi:MAG: pilus assembly protein PilM [Verrucomicrobiae bacterium]|nr:pilus assembly protein PilM [Verrucomicrobiae bacterium]MCX7723172.1 pilus assembly protein PilM [Verrucomicrobiae bacterium]MDW7980054.1 type IV pilus assembly protein PilM [Verrucomicrobiales bacterium]